LGSKSFKVIKFGTNQKGICDFLLVVNSNLGRISHSFKATGSISHLWDIPVFYLTPSLEVTLVIILMNLISPKTGYIVLPSCEDGSILFICFDTVLAYDAQTDGRTDTSAIANTAGSYAACH